MNTKQNTIKTDKTDSIINIIYIIGSLSLFGFTIYAAIQ